MKVAALALVATTATASSSSQQPCFVAPVGARCHLRQSAPTAAVGARRTSGLQMKLWDFGLNREVCASLFICLPAICRLEFNMLLSSYSLVPYIKELNGELWGTLNHLVS